MAKNGPATCRHGLNQSQPVLLDLLAYLTALTVNATGNTANAAVLAKAVGLDIVLH